MAGESFSDFLVDLYTELEGGEDERRKRTSQDRS